MFLTTTRSAHFCAAVLALGAVFGVFVPGQRRCSAQSPWQNPVDPLDVTGDGIRAADDFNTERNELFFPRISDPRTGILPKPATPPPFYDITGDLVPTIAPVDLLQLINELIVNENSFLAGVPPGAVTVNGPASVRFEFRTEAGIPVETVSVGDEFFLTAIVSDDRDDPLGVFASYIDLLYDTALADLSGAPILNPNDVLVAAGTPTTLGIEEIGSVSSSAKRIAPEILPSQRDLFSIPMLATADGKLVADGANGYVLLVGIDEAIAPSFVADALTIVPEPATSGLAIYLVLLGFVRRRNSLRCPA